MKDQGRKAGMGYRVFMSEADVAGESPEIKRHHREMMRNNAMPSQYPTDGKPSGAFHEEGSSPDHVRMRKGIPSRRLHPHAGYEDHE